jgi:transglutaminase-like putative cysteine protease
VLNTKTTLTAWPRLGLSTWNTLPRDARDTLFLLAVIGWMGLMQLRHIPWWCSVLIVGILVWRSVQTVRALPLPGWPWRLGLLVITLGATALTHKTLLGRDAGVTLMVVLLAMKTLEMRARRDAFVVFFLAFFTLLTQFFHSQSLLTAAGILVALWGLLTALVNAHMPLGRPPLAQAARSAASLLALGAPIMLVLFVLFPRMGPLWGVPENNLIGVGGLSDEMQVGQIAQLVKDDRVALRVRFEGPPPSPDQLYFRGPVLSQFDGVHWRPLRSGFPAHMALGAQLRVSGPALRYEVTMEPHNKPWLLLLEAAAEAPSGEGIQASMSEDLQWSNQRTSQTALRYRAASHTRFSHGPLRAELALQDFLNLPPGYNPRTLAVALALRRQIGAGPAFAPQLVQAALERLRSGGYRYNMEPGVFGTHTADEFWFDRREGFCEHIASSFVILMRAMDIPARIVTGYHGGEQNRVDGNWIVRQQDAHAWAEVWLQDQGWVRVDPTSAVAPERTNALERLRPSESALKGALNNALAGALRTLDPDTFAQLRQFWDATNHQWNQWVLNYSENQQLDLLKRLGFEAPRTSDLLTVLLVLLLLCSGGATGWWLWGRRQADPWLRLLGQARQRLHQAGLPLATAQPPRALAAWVQQRYGEQAFSQALQAWLLRLEAQRYSRSPPASVAQLRREFRQLDWPTTGDT